MNVDITNEVTMIDVNMLKNLKKYFDNYPKGLTMSHFLKAVKSVMYDNVTDQQLKYMFMKIDANSDGTVDWDEFTNFMLFEISMKQDIEKDRFPVIEMCNDRSTKIRHKLMIEDLVLIPDYVSMNMSNYQIKYVSISRDGKMGLWKENLSCEKLIDICHQPENGWKGHHANYIDDYALNDRIPSQNIQSIPLVSCAFMPLSKVIVVGTTENSLLFYDLQTYELISRISNTKKIKRSSPLTMIALKLHNTKEILITGDNLGNITIIHFGISQEHPSTTSITITPTNHTRRLNNNGNVWHICDGKAGLSCHHTKPVIENVEIFSLSNVHDDWITQLRYSPDLGCLISSSLDTKIKFIEIGENNTKRVKRTFHGNEKSVYTFDISHVHKFIACGGQNRCILIFDMHSLKIASTRLQHLAAIEQIRVCDQLNLLLSMSSDKVLKTYDTRNFQCMQTLQDNCIYRPENRLSTILIDYKNMYPPQIVATSNHLIRYQLHADLDANCTQSSTDTSHPYPLVDTVYNSIFNYVVSCDTGNETEQNRSIVNVWDVKNGKRVFSFQAPNRLTCVDFDHSKRRLVTGQNDGVKMYNFSNGQLLYQFQDQDKNSLLEHEITSVHNYIEFYHDSPRIRRRYVICTGYDGTVKVWQELNVDEPESIILNPYQSDSLCMACLTNSIVATGASDGRITLFSLVSRQVIGSVIIPTLPIIQISNKQQQTSRTIFENSKILNEAIQLDGDPSINVLKWLKCDDDENRQLLFSGSGDGVLRVWRLDRSSLEMLLQIRICPLYKHRSCAAITCIAIDDEKMNSIAIGDSDGMVSIWDISQMNISTLNALKNNITNSSKNICQHISECVSYEMVKTVFKHICSWEAHENQANMCSVAFTNDYVVDHLDIPCIVTSSSDCNIKLWTPESQLVSIFGLDTFMIEDRSTWIDKEPTRQISLDYEMLTKLCWCNNNDNNEESTEELNQLTPLDRQTPPLRLQRRQARVNSIRFTSHDVQQLTAHKNNNGLLPNHSYSQKKSQPRLNVFPIEYVPFENQNSLDDNLDDWVKNHHQDVYYSR